MLGNFFIILSAAVIGSFLNMLISRMPTISQQNFNFFESLKHLALPRSHCDNCHKTLTPVMLIPIISFIIQKSYCKFCGVKIHIQNLITELITVILAIILLIIEPDFIKAFWLFVFFSAGLALAIIDINHHLLLDEITIPLMWLGLLLNLSNIFVSLDSAIIGAIVGYLILWFLYQIFFLLRKKEAIGYGDFKLLAAIGAWFGLQSLSLVLLISSILAILFFIFKKYSKDQAIAFGPFMILATFIIILLKLA